MGKSSVGIMVGQVCGTINTVIYLLVDVITKALEIIAEFQRMAFPNCMGAISPYSAHLEERVSMSNKKVISHSFFTA